MGIFSREYPGVFEEKFSRGGFSKGKMTEGNSMRGMFIGKYPGGGSVREREFSGRGSFTAEMSGDVQEECLGPNPHAGLQVSTSSGYDLGNYG